MQFTKIPEDTFEKLSLNAGVMTKSFTPATGVVGTLLGATTGGIAFSTNPEYSDFGEDIDNAPNNTKQLKRLMSVDATMSGTLLTLDPATIKTLLAGADIDSQDTTKIVPRDHLVDADFEDIWWIGDYSDQNTGSNAGFIAIHMKNALNTVGFQSQSTKDAKNTFAFEFHAHYDIENQTDIPFEIYCKAGS